MGCAVGDADSLALRKIWNRRKKLSILNSRPGKGGHGSQLHGRPARGDCKLTTVLFHVLCTVMEWLVDEHRAHAIILQHCFLALGIIFLSGAATRVFHWRLVFLLAGAPMFPIISNIW